MHFTHHVLPRDCKFSEIPRKCARGRYFNTDFCTAYRFLALLIIMYYVCYTSSLFFDSILLHSSHLGVFVSFLSGGRACTGCSSHKQLAVLRSQTLAAL